LYKLATSGGKNQALITLSAAKIKKAKPTVISAKSYLVTLLFAEKVQKFRSQ